MTTTPLLGITQLEEDQALPEVVVNEAVVKLEGFAGFTVIEDRSLTAPPGSPSNGQRYLVAATATGDWAGHDGDIAYYVNGAWEFFDIFEGLAMWIKDENVLRVWDGSSLTDPVGAAGITVEDEGVSEGTGITTLNFAGAGVSVSVTGTEAEVTISGGGGGGGSFLGGAMVSKAADETAANYSAGVMVPWTSEVYDTDGYHDNATNNSRLTAPATGKYIATYGIEINSGTAAEFVRAVVAKNGSTSWLGRAGAYAEVSTGTTLFITGTTPAVDLTAGDYLECWLDTEVDTSITVVAAVSYFAMHRVA